jgi:hypothetical protein
VHYLFFILVISFFFFCFFETEIRRVGSFVYSHAITEKDCVIFLIYELIITIKLCYDHKRDSTT